MITISPAYKRYVFEIKSFVPTKQDCNIRFPLTIFLLPSYLSSSPHLFKISTSLPSAFRCPKNCFCHGAVLSSKHVTYPPPFCRELFADYVLEPVYINQ